MAMQHAVKTTEKESYVDFMFEHPELTVLTDRRGNVVRVIFPINATRTSYTIVNGKLTQLFYYYKGEPISFSD